MENAEPDVKRKEAFRAEAFQDRVSYAEWLTGKVHQKVIAEEIYEVVKGLKDPEYPLTLEELAVVTRDQIELAGRGDNWFTCMYTPTVPHCSQANTIGLSIKAVLQESFPSNCHIAVTIKPHTHNSATSISKQINDKERVAAALENPTVHAHIGRALAGSRNIEDAIASSLIDFEQTNVRNESTNCSVQELSELIIF